MLFGVGAVGRQSIVGKRGVQGASLDLSFMNPGTLPSGVTFTRASGTASWFDVTGTMQFTAVANTPRWDYDPVTHVLKGLLIEASRTNLLLNSATLGTQSVTVTATPYMLSFYGTGTITLTGVSTAGPLTGTGAFPTRVVLPFTPTAGTLTLTVTGTVQNAQLESAAYATSYIPTFGTTQGRGAESANMPVGAWYNAAAGSLVTESSYSAINPASTTRIAQFDDNAATNNIIHIVAGTNGRQYLTSTVASVTKMNLGNNSTYVQGAIVKIGSSWVPDTQLFNLNGIQPQSSAVVGAIPSGITTMRFGGDQTGGCNGNVYLRRVRYWPRALSAAELQAVTT